MCYNISNLFGGYMFDLDSTIKGLKNGSIKDIELFSHITDEPERQRDNRYLPVSTLP